MINVYLTFPVYVSYSKGIPFYFVFSFEVDRIFWQGIPGFYGKVEVEKRQGDTLEMMSV